MALILSISIPLMTPCHMVPSGCRKFWQCNPWLGKHFPGRTVCVLKERPRIMNKQLVLSAIIDFEWYDHYSFWWLGTFCLIVPSPISIEIIFMLLFMIIKGDIHLVWINFNNLFMRLVYYMHCQYGYCCILFFLD